MSPERVVGTVEDDDGGEAPMTQAQVGMGRTGLGTGKRYDGRTAVNRRPSCSVRLGDVWWLK